MSKLKTALAFSKNVLTTGALFQTSRKVELDITSKIEKGSNQIFVEFGMGHGNITKEILDKMSDDGKLYSFEINKDFCEVVRKNILDKRLTIINKGAEQLNNVVDGQVDGIISSIPFSIMPKELGEKIIDLSYQKMKPSAFFSQVQYSRVLKKRFAAAFDRMEINQISVIPPEWVYHCYKKSEAL